MALLNIDNIVNINITVSEETGVNLGFNIGLIVGSSGHIAADTRIKRYTSAADMLTDGFLVTDPEYLAAVMYFAQSPSPKAVYIGTMDGSEGSAETLLGDQLRLVRPVCLRCKRIGDFRDREVGRRPQGMFLLQFLCCGGTAGRIQV